MRGVDQVGQLVCFRARDPGGVEEALVLLGAEGNEALDQERRSLLFLDDPAEAEGRVDHVGSAGRLKRAEKIIITAAFLAMNKNWHMDVYTCIPIDS